MGGSAFRGMICCVLTVLFPFLLFAADSNAALLYSSGPAWVNGAHVPRPSSVIFSADLLQTRSDSVANINQPGSTVRVLSDSLVQFEGNSGKIDHGGVTVSTSEGMATTAGDVKVEPASSASTEFNVRDVDRTVRIAARKGDVTVSDGKGSVTLAQGRKPHATSPRTTPPITASGRIASGRLGRLLARVGELSIRPLRSALPVPPRSASPHGC
jgi:hypothetical protein